MAIVAAGITVGEALKAHDQLRAAGIAARVIDLYSVKPVDRATLREAARDCRGGLIVVEDHRPEGGLGDAVAEAFEGSPAPAIRRLAVAVMSDRRHRRNNWRTPGSTRAQSWKPHAPRGRAPRNRAPAAADSSCNR